MVVRLNRLENQVRPDVGPDRAAAVREPAAQGTGAQVPGGRGVPLPGGRAAERARRLRRPRASRPDPRTGTAGPAAAARRCLRPGRMPDAPGAPRPLGTTAPSAPLPPTAQPPGATAGAPMQLPGGALAGIGDLIDEDPAARRAPRPRPDGPHRRHLAAALPRTGPERRRHQRSATREADYDAAYAYVLQRQYEQAEMGFRRFLQSHPRDRLVPDATYWLGESYLQRNRHREAAEQFLNISTDTRSRQGARRAAEARRRRSTPSAPGTGLRRVRRTRPQVPAGRRPNVRQGAEREQKRARCA